VKSNNILWGKWWKVKIFMHGKKNVPKGKYKSKNRALNWNELSIFGFQLWFLILFRLQLQFFVLVFNKFSQFLVMVGFGFAFFFLFQKTTEAKISILISDVQFSIFSYRLSFCINTKNIVIKNYRRKSIFALKQPDEMIKYHWNLSFHRVVLLLERKQFFHRLKFSYQYPKILQEIEKNWYFKILLEKSIDENR